jgi:hypothetical protein
MQDSICKQYSYIRHHIKNNPRVSYYDYVELCFTSEEALKDLFRETIHTKQIEIIIGVKRFEEHMNEPTKNFHSGWSLLIYVIATCPCPNIKLLNRLLNQPTHRIGLVPLFSVDSVYLNSLVTKGLLYLAQHIQKRKLEKNEELWFVDAMQKELSDRNWKICSMIVSKSDSAMVEYFFARSCLHNKKFHY